MGRCFPDECDDGNLGGFANGTQSGVFGLETGIEPHGDEGGHVECVAQGFSPAADEGLALPLAGFAVVRGQAGKAADLFLSYRAKLG